MVFTTWSGSLASDGAPPLPPTPLPPSSLAHLTDSERDFGMCRTSTSTTSRPTLNMSIREHASQEASHVSGYGDRSLTTTSTERPLWVSLSTVPMGYHGWAAVREEPSK